MGTNAGADTGLAEKADVSTVRAPLTQTLLSKPNVSQRTPWLVYGDSS